MSYYVVGHGDVDTLGKISDNYDYDYDYEDDSVSGFDWIKVTKSGRHLALVDEEYTCVHIALTVNNAKT